MPEDHTELGELGELGKDGKLGGYKGDAILRRLPPPVYGFGASGQRPYQSNGCGLRLTTTFLVCV